MQVVSVGVVGAIVVAKLGMNVGKARHKYGVKPPTMHALPADTTSGTAEDAARFNCTQRAHQNTVENWPTTAFLLTLGGVEHPRCAAGAGLMWAVGRILYARGYTSGDPSKRIVGGITSNMANLFLLGFTAKLAYRLLKQ